jgi:hypothetical protein
MHCAGSARQDSGHQEGSTCSKSVPVEATVCCSSAFCATKTVIGCRAVLSAVPARLTAATARAAEGVPPDTAYVGITVPPASRAHAAQLPRAQPTAAPARAKISAGAPSAPARGFEPAGR